MLDSVAYTTYYVIASGAEPPKSKKPKMKFDSVISSEEIPSKKKPTNAKKDVPSKKKPTSIPKLTKKKALVEGDRGKGLNVLSEIALSEAAQLKEATKQSKKYFHISQASGSGDGTDFEFGVPDEQQRKTSSADEGIGTKPGVPDVPKYLSESENESWGDSDDNESNDDNSDEVIKDDDEDDVESDANDDNEASDSENTNSNEDENLNLNLKDDEEEEKEEEDVRSPDSFEFNNDDEEYDELYKDVNVRLTVIEHEEVRKGDAEMTVTTHESASHEKSYEQVIEDAHMTLTSSQKTKGSNTRIGFATKTALQSYTAEFEKKAQAKKEKYIDIIEKSVKEIIKDEVKSQLPQILPKEISDFATPVIQSTINESLENVVLAKFSSQSQSTYEAATSLTEFELKKILLDELKKSKLYQAAEQHRDLYNALVKFYQLDKDLLDSYGKSYSLKRGRKDKDKDEDPSAGSD
ncbi:hypothetical protein Tco_0763605 [Tanacetum coccineum]